MYLIIRGACTWIPDKPNVSIKSIIWAKLEHSRVYCFGKTDPNIYIGSLDLVTHKLDCRIETLAKVSNIKTMVTMCEYINRYVTNKEGSWKMDSEGNYHLEKK
jgi:polyphosphate kinase